MTIEIFPSKGKETRDDFREPGRGCQALSGKGCTAGDRGDNEMNTSARYVKIVEWSDVDQCFVGSCPGLFYGGCHGDDERVVFAELCEIVNETIELYVKEGRDLPPSTAGKDYANKMIHVA